MLFSLSHKALKCQDLSACNEDLAWDASWITFHSCHRHMAHNALIFYAYFPVKQHNVHEQALLCGGWMLTSLLSHQLPLPETLNHQTPVLLCELAFYSRASQTCSGASPLTRTLIWCVSLSLSPPSFNISSPLQRYPSSFYSPLWFFSRPSLSLQLHLTNPPQFPSPLSYSPSLCFSIQFIS